MHLKGSPKRTVWRALERETSFHVHLPEMGSRGGRPTAGPSPPLSTALLRARKRALPQRELMRHVLDAISYLSRYA